MNAPSPDDPTPLHSFTAEAMNTDFIIRIHHDDPATARRISGNAFRQLEELESRLSRYRHDSDVTRINLLQAGESMLLSDVTYRCLQQSLEATAMTAGLFDVTLGAQTWRQPKDTSAPPRGKLVLTPNRAEIRCEEAGREIDFGGIGKGFALDEMKTTLCDLGADRALISCGGSTHLAIGPDPWTLELRGDRENRKIRLTSGALSASGIGMQGEHVVHPDTGKAPTYAFRRVWVVAEQAALADALSTACLIMDEETLDSFAQSVTDRGISIYTEPGDEGPIRRII